MPSPYAMLKSNRRSSAATKAQTKQPQKQRPDCHKSNDRITTKVSSGLPQKYRLNCHKSIDRIAEIVLL